MSEGSVTHWLRLLQAGDHSGARPLWERYFQLLVGRARASLRGVPCRAAGEEDVAIGAIDSFCRGAEQGRFPDLDDRHDLWRLLVLLTAGKVARMVRGEFRQQRGEGKVWTEADLLGNPQLPDASRTIIIGMMNTVAGIETAIERLPAPQVAELAVWLEQFRLRRAMHPPAEAWLERARGAAQPGVTTAGLMALTRGEE